MRKGRKKKGCGRLIRPGWFRYQIGFQNPQTEKDLESVENMRKFLSALYRGISDPRAGDFMVTENMIESLGTPPRGSFMTEKVCPALLLPHIDMTNHFPLVKGP